MSVVLPVVLDLALKAGLLCLLGFCVSALARRRSAALRHDVWLVVLACSALLPVAALGAGLLHLAPAFAPVQAVVAGAGDSLAAGGGGEVGRVLQQVWTAEPALSASPWLSGALLIAWLAGALLVAARFVAGYLAGAAIARRAGPARFAGSPLSARMSAELASPAVFGAVRPVILLPRAASRWPRARLEAVLAHEAAHAARRDGALELVAQAACAVHWFNPLVWAAARALRTERELACDDRVVAAGLDPRAYASCLVQVAREAMAGHARPAALLAMAQRPELERRILALLAARPAHGRESGRLRAALALGALVLFVPLAALTTPAAAVSAPGSVQPGSGPLSGIDDPMSERVPLAYHRLLARAASVPAEGPDGAAIAALKAELDRPSHGYGDLVRERAIWTLAQVEDGRMFEPVSRHAADPDWRIRAYAAWGMAAAGDRRATALLVPMLRDPVWRVRAMASAALADLGDPAASYAMVGALRDPAWQVRISAAAYLDRLGDPALTQRLRPLLRDPHWGVRSKVERILARA